MAIVALDFDHTLFYFNGDDELCCYDGARENIEKLKSMGHEIVIHTCRIGIAMENGTLDQEVAAIQQTLENFRIPFDSIWMGPKMVADVYIDDLAVRFEGDWTSTFENTVKHLDAQSLRRAARQK